MHQDAPLSEEQIERRRLLRLVMCAVFAWGTLLAIGSALFGFDASAGAVKFSPNPVRGLIVEACVLGFLGVWLLALSRQR